jgi:DNA polymerase-3 subunit gamma/tau
MSYLSLYRKWRSQDFGEIIGQPVIVQTLKNAIENNRLSHAYLFTGPRGTGKTSTARILAKALNCKEGPTAQPCGKCESCEKIRQGHSVDVSEIDAASNRGIDEIRELRERVRYAPMEGKYKIYIIDEVHMLTAEAFNALLKTLEEPPSHAIFVLATTEVQKVPLTIASRCQRLDFARLKLNEIKGQLQKIAGAEGFKIEDKALDLIARSAEGAMRDAISLLDQLVSFAGKNISYDSVVTLLGTAEEEMLFDMADAMAGNSPVRVMELIRKAMEEGRAILQVTRDLVFHFRNLLHSKLGAGEALELTQEQLAKLVAQAENFSADRIKEIMRGLSRAELDMKWHPHARLVLEVALLELMETGSKDKGVETGMVVGNVKKEVGMNTRTESTIPVPTSNLHTGIPAQNPTSNIKEDQQFDQIKHSWNNILESMRKKSIYGYVSLHESEPIEVSKSGKLVIGFRRGYSFHKERLEEAKNREAVEESIREVVGSRFPIECIIRDGSATPSLSVKTVADFFEGRIV